MIHLDKPWFYDTLECWKEWPGHHFTNDIYWYYVIEASFYLSLLPALLTDHKRKDFLEMVVHHVATLLLMSLSWVYNFVRVGTLVLVLHDAVDSWLEAAKIAKYLKRDKAAEILFLIFTMVWIVTRVIVFPFKIVYSSMFESYPILNETRDYFSRIYYVMNVLLCTLQVLHIIWSYYISLVALDAIKGVEIKKDSRSSLESESGSEDETSHMSKPNKN